MLWLGSMNCAKGVFIIISDSYLCSKFGKLFIGMGLEAK